jgi:hypothetical protein
VTATADLKDAILAAKLRFDAAVEGVDVSELETTKVCGIWSTRDVAGHLADWNAELLAAAEHGLGGPAPAGQPIQDGEAFNTSHAEARMSDSWQAARGDLDTSVQRAADLAARLSPNDLAVPAFYPWGGNGAVSDMFSVIVDHMGEHTSQVEAGLK